MFWRSGSVVLGVESHSKLKVPQVAGLVQAKGTELHEQHGVPVLVVIDIGGVGGGVYDLCEDTSGVTYKGVHFGQKSHDQKKFTMLRDEMFWTLRQHLQPGNEVDDVIWMAEGEASDRCMNQLAQIQFSYDHRGRIKLESKDEMEKRGMASPDEADAAALAFVPEKVRRSRTIPKPSGL